MNYSISLTNDSLTAIFTGGSDGVRVHTINSSHPSWSDAVDLITRNGSAEILEKLMNVKETITRFAHGKISVQDNAVLYNGVAVHGFVVDRILEFAKNGLPYQPLVKFLDRVSLNPSARSIEELYQFLEHRKMPITPEGTFLAYKSVRADYTDHHTGTISNKVGESPNRLERNQVDDDASRGCSYGYHVGSLAYAENFGGGERHLMIVEVDPADVVSVPYDCNAQKLRCTYYKVIDEFKHILDDNYSDVYHEPDWDHLGDYDFDEDCDDECECHGDATDDDTDGDENTSYDAYHVGWKNGYNHGKGTGHYDSDVPVNADYAEEYERGYRRGFEVGLNSVRS